MARLFQIKTNNASKRNAVPAHTPKFLYKRKKIIWVIKREDILECVYAKFFVNKSYYPEAGDMSFKLKPNGRRAKRKLREGVYVDNSIGISYRNVKRMMELGYSITISNEMQNNKG